MKDSPQPTERRRYDAAFRAKALQLAGESRSTQAAARTLNINVKLLCYERRLSVTDLLPVRFALVSLVVD